MVNNYCDAGLNQLVISPEGDIRPCVCLKENLGNIFKENIKEIWKKNKFILNIRKLRYIPDDCKSYKYLALCRGGCRASARGYSGKINSRDPRWNKMEFVIFKNKKAKYRKETFGGLISVNSKLFLLDKEEYKLIKK